MLFDAFYQLPPSPAAQGPGQHCWDVPAFVPAAVHRGGDGVVTVTSA